MKRTDRVGRVKDRSGERFHLLSVVSLVPRGEWVSRNAQWLCLCDCGTFTVATGNNLESGKHKSCGCLKTSTTARRVDAKGYVSVRTTDLQNPSQHSGWVKEHTLVMCQCLGRYLLKGETVHHLNGVRHDNRPENLELWSTSQPSGQRVQDKVRWAIELLRLYQPDSLRERDEQPH